MSQISIKEDKDNKKYNKDQKNKLDVWKKGNTIAGRNANQIRVDHMGRVIHWDQYHNPESLYGWIIGENKETKEDLPEQYHTNKKITLEELEIPSSVPIAKIPHNKLLDSKTDEYKQERAHAWALFDNDNTDVKCPSCGRPPEKLSKKEALWIRVVIPTEDDEKRMVRHQFIDHRAPKGQILKLFLKQYEQDIVVAEYRLASNLSGVPTPLSIDDIVDGNVIFLRAFKPVDLMND